MTGPPAHLNGHGDERAARVLCAIVHHEATRGTPPDYGALMAACDLSRSNVQTTLVRLRRAGLVTWDYGKSSTIRSTVAIVVPTLSA